ncbi:SDR family oxidoreductase [Phormidesmis sp. 146-33]
MSPPSEQVILITGASAGIGAALARVLATHYPGICLVLAARSVEKLSQVAEDCSKAGADVLTVPTDIAQAEQIQALVDAAIARFQRVDVLVNNAGYGQMGPIELIPTAAVQRQFQVNLLGTIALTQALIPIMRNQGGGKIINLSSLGGKIAFPFGGLYSASKFAIEALSDALRQELEPFNIRVSVIEPGPVSTEFFEVVDREVDRTIQNPEKSPYRAAFKKLEDLEKQTSSRAWTSERVASVIIRAIAAQHPKPRYVAATSGNFLLFMMTKVLPTSLVDKFWQRFYGIDLVAKDWQAQQRSPKQ